MIIGSHVGIGGTDKFLGSVKEALSYGASTFMIYTGAPQNTRRQNIDGFKIEEAKALMSEAGINPEHIVVHAPYIMNLANPEAEKRAFAVGFLSEEIRRTDALGATQIVLHPGAALNQERQVGLDFIVAGLKEVLENTKDLSVKIALETMAGKGTELGMSFDEIGYMVHALDSERISVCFDTCHTHDSGYDLSNFDAVMREFDEKVGVHKISVFHINDSKNERGARKDRHENIGFGHIGFDVLTNIIHHPDFAHIPKILETPYVSETDDAKDKSFPPYLLEIEMIKNKTFDPELIEKIRKA